MTAASHPGVLYVVATPIGNLEDITLRALRILKEVDLVACEDTRRTSLLLHHFGISTRVQSCHKFNERHRLQSLQEMLQSGKSVALVSDAGTPSLSDPGALLVRSCRSSGIPVVSIPGASAVLTALSCSSFAGEPYLFVGFLPASRGKRQKALALMKEVPWNLVFYESPLRTAECLQDIHSILGDRTVFLGRELTKHFEETLEAPAAQMAAQIAAREIKGEITLIVKGAVARESAAEDLPLAVEKARQKIAAENLSKKEASRQTAAETGFPAREIYRRLIES